MPKTTFRSRWIALITGIFSVLIGIIYLFLIAILDTRGPMLPPPPEAMGVAEVDVVFPFVEVAQRPF